MNAVIVFVTAWSLVFLALWPLVSRAFFSRGRRR